MKYVISESQYKKLLKEDNNEYPPITLESIKKDLLDEIKENVDIETPYVKRRVFSMVDEYAKQLYYDFMYKLSYISEEENFKDILAQIR